MDYVFIFLTTLPLLIVGFYIYMKDKEKEPAFLLSFLFLSGILGGFLTLKVKYLLGKAFPFFTQEASNLSVLFLIPYTFIGISLIEESIKWLATYLIGWRNKEFNELYDSIVYSVFVSLGFAILENILYVRYHDFTFPEAIVRGVMVVAIHLCDGIIIGYFLGRAKEYKLLNKTREKLLMLLLSLIIPIFIHGLYDYLIFIINTSELISILLSSLVVSIYILAYILIKKFQD